jgi:hypothetical protein
VALIVALAIVGTAFAQEERPPEPVCLQGQVTVVPAAWVDEVVTVIHHDAVTHQEWAPPVTHEITVVDQEAWDEWVPPVTHIEHRHGWFGHWQMGPCHGGGWFCTERTVVDVAGYYIHHDAVTHQETVVDAEGYWVTIVDEEAWDETIVTAAGYWTDPVCSEPVCESTPLYTMYVLQDFDAPVGYLQQGTCYIESPSYPSVGSQAAFCTFPFEGTGWTFRTDRAPYAGEVSIDCHGNVHFGWPAWDPAWVR